MTITSAVSSARDRKITASKSTLNYISILAAKAAEQFTQDGAYCLAQDAQKFSDDIYEVLSATGFYED